MNFIKEDLPYLDIIWFAVDNFNKVIELASGGSAILPDFRTCSHRRLSNKCK